MRSKVLEKAYVIGLRRKGFSYKEILEKVPVSKSSISLWLQDMELTKEEKQIMKGRKDGNITKGRIRAAASLHRLKEERDAVTRTEAAEQFKGFRSERLFCMGVGLYWAEGSKRSNAFIFTNSDPEMINMMLEWMVRFLGVDKDQVSARLYTHKPFAGDNLEDYWASETGIPRSNFNRTVYKPTGLLIKKRPNYKGCLRIELGKVSHFRKYLFWQKMLLEDMGKQG